MEASIVLLKFCVNIVVLLLILYLDIVSVYPGHWITSNVINHYIMYLMLAVGSDTSTDDYFVGNTYFTVIESTQPQEASRSLEAFLPVHVDGNHWVAVVVRGLRAFLEGMTSVVSRYT